MEEVVFQDLNLDLKNLVKRKPKKEFREICGNILEKEFKVNNPEKAINYINRKIKMKDKVFERYNYLNIH